MSRSLTNRNGRTTSQTKNCFFLALPSICLNQSTCPLLKSCLSQLILSQSLWTKEHEAHSFLRLLTQTSLAPPSYPSDTTHWSNLMDWNCLEHILICALPWPEKWYFSIGQASLGTVPPLWSVSPEPHEPASTQEGWAVLLDILGWPKR